MAQRRGRVAELDLDTRATSSTPARTKGVARPAKSQNFNGSGVRHLTTLCMVDGSLTRGGFEALFGSADSAARSIIGSGYVVPLGMVSDTAYQRGILSRARCASLHQSALGEARVLERGRKIRRQRRRDVDLLAGDRMREGEPRRVEELPLEAEHAGSP